MPHKASHFDDQSTESEELFQISPHCTWCALHAFRLQKQERSHRCQREPYDQEDSSSSTGGERELMCSRRKTQKPAVCDSYSDSSDDESLPQEGTGKCGRYGPDVQGKCSHVRNTCVCRCSEGKVRKTGTNARCARCSSPDAELLETCEDDKSGCDNEQETADDARKNFRQIVMESRCPCLCAYLHFTDTVDACTCVSRSLSCSAPGRDSKTVNVPNDHTVSPSAPKDKNSLGCCIARYFSTLRKHSKPSSRDVNTHQPSPLPLEPKNSMSAGDKEIVKDTFSHKDLDPCGICQISYRNSKMMKSNVLKKPSKRESYQSATIQQDTNVDSAPRESTAIMGRDSCVRCQRADCGLDDAEKVQSHVRCTCDCESRNKDLKKFRSNLKRICRALSGCKRSTCTCKCHGKQDEGKGNVNDTRVLNEEENRRRKKVNRGSGGKTTLPKRGLLALKYEILRCKELDGNSKETESGSSNCEGNQRHCHCPKQPPETEQRCSSKDARRSERKLERCCVSEEKKCTRKACLNEQNKPRLLEGHKSKNNSRKRQDGTVLKPNIVSEDKEMIANHRHPKEKTKQKRRSSRKNNLTNAQCLHERDLSERSADDSSDESELEARKNRTRKAHEMKTNPKSPREELDDVNEPFLDPIRAEVVKIGDRYYQAVRHQTAHVNIMSFKNLKDHREIHRRWKSKKSPRVEVRLRVDTTSSEEDSSDDPVPSAGPLGNSTCHPSKSDQRKSKKRRTARDKAVKKAVGSSTKEAKKRHREPPSTGATDGHCGSSPTPPVTLKRIDEKEADRKESSAESKSRDYVERLPKAMTDPPPSPEKAESPLGWKSEGSQLKRKGVSARTLELKQMSDRWFSNDAKQWCSDKLENSGDAINSGTCDVRPFTASSSAS